jgi:archaellum biogenesis ATPase FlaH
MAFFGKGGKTWKEILDELEVEWQEESGEVIDAPPAGAEPSPGFEGMEPEEQLRRYLDALGVEPHGTFILSVCFERRDEKNLDQWHTCWTHRTAARMGTSGDARISDTLHYGKHQPTDEAKGKLSSWRLKNSKDDSRNWQFFLRTAVFRLDAEKQLRSYGQTNVERRRAYFVEPDGIPLQEQRRRVEEYADEGLIFNAGLFSGSKSLHLQLTRAASWQTTPEQDRWVDKALCVLFDGDTKAQLLNQACRLPGFKRAGKHEQRLLWATEEIYRSYSELREVLERLLAQRGVEDLEAAYTALAAAQGQREQRQQVEARSGGELARQWAAWEEAGGWSDGKRTVAKSLKAKLTTENLIGLLPKRAADLVNEGSASGHRNDDGLYLTRELRGAVDVLIDLGLPGMKELAQGVLERFIETSGEDIDRDRLFAQYDGAEGAMPGRPVETFLNSLHFETGGELGERKAAEETGGVDEGEKRLSYGELIETMLIAVTEGESDRLMELRAEAISRFRLTGAQIEAKLFERHMELETGCIRRAAPKALDLSKISGVDWLVPGFLPANDLALLYGAAGTGKTTAALVLARAVLQGTGVLDHEAPAAKGKVLFIASDSGPQPLVAAMQDLEMISIPEVQKGDQQRFFVWAADQGNGSTAWTADLRGCIELLEFVRKNEITLVVLDSCKAICRGTEVDYASNHSVTALLTYLKDVVAPHTSLLLLNHDGTARNATAGAKAWKEIPSVVHQLEIEELNGQMVHERRLWQLRKSRLGTMREFRYQLADGEPVLCVGEETFGNCHDRLREVLKRAYQNGEVQLSRRELIARVQMLAQGVGTSEKTIDNALVAATRAKHPEICRAGRGLVKLAPRIVQSLKGSESNGKEIEQNLDHDYSLSISRPFPDGKFENTREGSPPAGSEVLEKFPSGNDGRSLNPSDAKGSRAIPTISHCALNGESAANPLLPGDRVQVRTMTGSWNSGWEVLAPPSTTGWVQVRSLLSPSTVTCFPKDDLRLDRSIPDYPASSD